MSFGPEYGWMRREWEGPSRDGCRQNRQCLAKSVASFAVQSPFGFSFISAHHSSLPTSGEQAASRTNAATSATARGIVPGQRHAEALPLGDVGPRNLQRSEEHTSELQSLMRISYAVFCLKKKITTN